MLVILGTCRDIYHVVTMRGHILPLIQLLYKQKGLVLLRGSYLALMSPVWRSTSCLVQENNKYSYLPQLVPKLNMNSGG